MINADGIPAMIRENEKLPKNADGHIVSPRYVAPSQLLYLNAWRQYLAAVPRKDWPEWLRRDIDAMKAPRSKVRETQKAVDPEA